MEDTAVFIHHEIAGHYGKEKKPRASEQTTSLCDWYDYKWLLTFENDCFERLLKVGMS